MKTILRIFETVNDTVDQYSGYVEGSNHSRDRYFSEYSELFPEVKHRPRHGEIRTPNAIIKFVGGVLENPDKIRGMRADRVIVHISDVSSDFIGEYVYPIVNGDNTKISFS